MSSGLSPPLIRMKPAHCSKAFGPSFATFKSCLRFVNMPCSSRYATIFFAMALDTPEIYSSREADAVFKSTPTRFTQSSTTPCRVSLKFFWFMSCWYWPTPMDFGSILTSSANGSCSLLAIEAALRCPTSKFGNSSVASLLAEYTEAPASLTMTYCTCCGISLIRSTIIISDSRDAVPLPREIREMLYFLIRSFTTFLDSSTLFCGGVGKMTVVSSTFPVASTTASLQPVRNAGSQPSTTRPATGGCIRSCFKFLPNTLMAPASAVSVRELRISRSMAGAIRRR